MKALTSLLACVLISADAFGQGGVVVTSAPSIEASIINSSSDLSAKLTQLLDEAKTQNEKLEEQLRRMGDPSAANLNSVHMIRQDILSSATSLKNKEQQREQMGAITGAEIFDDDAFGLVPSIGATVTKKDGTEVERNPELYRMDAAMRAQVKEHKNVRDQALERRKQLKQELAAALQELEAATDLAQTIKLDAIISVLEGEIDDCNQTILISQGDVAMTEKELTGHARIMAKAKQEEATMNRPPPATPGTGLGGFPKMGAPKKLPWGRKGSEGNAGTDAGTTAP